MKHSTSAPLVAAFLCCVIAVSPYQASAQTLAPVPLSGVPQSNAAGTLTPSLGRIFSDTLTDFQRLPSVDSAVIMSMGGLAAVVGHPADRRLSNGLYGSTAAKDSLAAGETLGGAQVQMGAAVATYAIGRITRNPKVGRIGADLIRAQLVSQTITQTIKFSVNRTRPDGTSLSFPSGHTSSAFATAAVLQRHLGWKAGIPAYAAAGYVAASRIQMKRHYLSDVAFGAAIGLMAGRTVTIGRGDARFAVAPAAAPGGVGVNVTWVGRN
jgi:hypothetical protein